ncbi:hypothetical protein M9H77_01525 [Catharanthus roseus]|uniref:Uncharacterized protein n=1 Tax=Catharanthus roseus TaxID=4058 RepID=A0ACC0C679_CATRO|nr:hypothetical protein M9H77_01525 [Catharanthus roseus]
MAPQIIIRPIILTILLCLFHTVASLPNTQIKLTLCNNGVYFNGDPFATSLAYIISELQSVTPYYQGYDYRNISPYPNAFAYGHASCNHNLTASDCAACLVAAKSAMLGACDSRIGADCVLVDCSMRYEQYPFSN